MFGQRAEVCDICGKAFLAGCVMGEPCPDCSSDNHNLIRAGWKEISSGFGHQFGLEEGKWEDPKFPGTIKTRTEAIKIQEGRDIEARRS